MPVPDVEQWLEDHYDPDSILGTAIEYWKDEFDGICEYSPHDKNKRKSNKNKHEKGDKRRDQKYKDKKRLDPTWKPRK